MSKCIFYVADCSLEPDNSTNWVDNHVCDCPPGYSGSDCSIIVPPKYSPRPDLCPDIFDGSMINVNFGDDPKHLECYADFNSTYNTVSLRDHRINVTVELDLGGNGNVSFVLFSRHRNSSDNDPPTEYRCFPSDADLNCSLTKCFAETVKGVSTYNCDAITCTSCGAPDKIAAGSVCSPSIWFLTLGLKPPVQFILSNLLPEQ